MRRASLVRCSPSATPRWRTRARYWSSPLEPVRTSGFRKASSMAQLDEKHIRRVWSVAESSWANHGTDSGLPLLAAPALGEFDGDGDAPGVAASWRVIQRRLRVPPSSKSLRLMGHQLLQHRQQPGPMVRQVWIEVLDVVGSRDGAADRNIPRRPGASTGWLVTPQQWVHEARGHRVLWLLPRWASRTRQSLSQQLS